MLFGHRGCCFTQIQSKNRSWLPSLWAGKWADLLSHFLWPSCCRVSRDWKYQCAYIYPVYIQLYPVYCMSSGSFIPLSINKWLLLLHPAALYCQLLRTRWNYNRCALPGKSAHFINIISPLVPTDTWSLFTPQQWFSTFCNVRTWPKTWGKRNIYILSCYTLYIILCFKTTLCHYIWGNIS